MDELPQEIVDNICSHLEHDSLKSVLLLSRKFQYAAEQCSNAFRSFCLTHESIDQFVATYTGRRFRYLRELEFRTSLPEPDVDVLEWSEEGTVEGTNRYWETREELEGIDENFTQQINLLFAALHSIEAQESGKTVGANVHLKIFTPTMDLDPFEWPLQRVCVSWRVHLLKPETLPKLESIHRLTIITPRPTEYGAGPHPALRKLDLRVLLDVSDRLPNLSSLGCRVGADELYSNRLSIEKLRYITQDWIGIRKDSYRGFAKSIEETSLRNLRHACLDFLFPQFDVEYTHQNLQMPDWVYPSRFDPFSTSLRIFSYQLRTFYLRAIADATLFWPDDGSIPHWPNLEHLHVMFHMSTPSGSWYFKEPAGLGIGGPETGYRVAKEEMYPPPADTEEDDLLWNETCEMRVDEASLYGLRYRVTPNNATLVPFLTGFAKSAVRMPRLRTFALWSPLTFNVRLQDEAYEHFDFGSISQNRWSDNTNHLAWGIAYTGPYEKAFDNETERDTIGQRKMWWRTGSWRPPSDLHELFQKIGEERAKDRSDWFDKPGLRWPSDFENFQDRYFRDQTNFWLGIYG